MCKASKGLIASFSKIYFFAFSGSIEALEKFPKLGQHAHLVEAPVFRPSEKEFKDPMRYIDRIRREAEPFGICKIIPPSSFKPGKSL
jgi:hypothetical protein